MFSSTQRGQLRKRLFEFASDTPHPWHSAAAAAAAAAPVPAAVSAVAADVPAEPVAAAAADVAAASFAASSALVFADMLERRRGTERERDKKREKGETE